MNSHYNYNMKNLYKLTLFPEIADRNFFSVDFVLLADLSQTHRISSGLRLRALVQDFGSGLWFRASAQDSALFCHSFASLRTTSEGALATEESPQETLRLRLRVTSKKGDR